ncbi:MAG: MarR family winged helix-turn-helix transcriptional regulator [Solirubrobacteraceae bacterium]
MDDPRLVASAVGRLIAAGIRQRGALARRLGVTTTDVLGLHYVVSAPGSAPGQLARALLVSPSGATAVIDRLSRVGLITRAPVSGRHRVALTATDAGRELHTQALAPLTHDIGRLTEELPRSQRVLLERFLACVADLAEREADELITRAEADARATAAIPPPVLWG